MSNVTGSSRGSRLSDIRLDALVADVEGEHILKLPTEWNDRRRDMKRDHLSALRELQTLRNAARGVANAIRCGTGTFIRGTMMEDELREALGLKDGEMWNFTTGCAEPSPFKSPQRAGDNHG